MSKHTPGPWHEMQYAHWFNIQSEPYYEDAVNLIDLEECDKAEANAKLMAAAPDLLQALQNLLLWQEGSINHIQALKDAQAAIRKATT